MNRHELLVAQFDSWSSYTRLPMTRSLRQSGATPMRGSQKARTPKLPDTFESYRVTVRNAAFLLGVSVL